MTGAGGSIEAAYWAFGADDFLMIADLPDNVTAASPAATVGATGTSSVSTTVLLTAAEMDAVGAVALDRHGPVCGDVDRAHHRQ